MRTNASKVLLAALLVSLPAGVVARDAVAAGTCDYTGSLAINGPNSTLPAWDYCSLQEPIYTGPGAGFLTQDVDSSTTAGTYALAATSLNNTAIYAYSEASGSGVVGLAGTTTVPAVTGGVVGNGSGSAYGVYGASGSGDAVYGTSTSGDGVRGVGGTGTASGVRGSTTSSTGVGVYASTTGTASTSYGLYASANGGYSFAVYGDSLSTSAGTGVSGHGGTGVSGFGGVYGVYGSSSGAGSDGVYGTCSGGECYAGYFAGPVTITGALTVSGGCTGCSDSRLKQNVKPLAGAMDQLLQLKGVTFEWQDPVGTHHERETGTVRGFIAQDVEKVFPDWVDDKGYIAPDGQKYRTLDTRQIEALEVESIRTLKDMADKANARADKAEKEIAALKAHNADNDARLDAIERGHPRAPVSPIGFNPATGLGAFGIVFGAVAGVFVARRKQGEKRA